MDLKIERISSGTGQYGGYDIVLDGGDFATTKVIDETGQKILNRLKINFQEWYLYDGGIKWVEDVFEQPDGSVIAKDAISREILKTSGVVSIEDFTFLFNEPTTRSSDIVINIKVKTGETVEVEIPL